MRIFVVLLSFVDVSSCLGNHNESVLHNPLSRSDNLNPLPILEIAEQVRVNSVNFSAIVFGLRRKNELVFHKYREGYESVQVAFIP